MRRSIATLATAGLAVGLALAGGGAATAYQPNPGDLYVAENPAACNKRPCVLYPKAAQTQTGRLVATFENSQTEPVGQTLPIHVSDDLGTTWRKLTQVKSPAESSADPAVAKYTSNWTNAYLYTLPEAVGDLDAGTLLLASVVSGDDEYAKEQKAANPAWVPTGDGDRRDIAIALYASTDDGATWSFENIIATGGWQGGSAGAIGRTSEANTYDQVDPLWEPFLLAKDGRLIAYYSDENDYLGFDPQTGAAIIDPANATAADSGGQILAHRTWDGTSASWSQAYVDVAGLTVDRGNGKTQIGGGRPGMTTVAPTTDGKWLLTYEYFGGGQNVKFKIAGDPLRFDAVGGAAGTDIGTLPAAGGALSPGGSPVLATFPDGRIVYNSNGSGNVWVNESGRSDGTWKRYQTTMPAGYSRNLTYVEGTGRVLILQASWAGNSIGPVKFGEVDLGESDGDYFELVNRATGEVLAPEAGKTQDANFTGNVADLVLQTRDLAATTQQWHQQVKGADVTFLNRSGGRALGIWQGTATAGQRLSQWVDDDGSDKHWKVVPSSDGYVKIQSVKNAALFITGNTTNHTVDLRASLPTTAGASADDAQEWLVVNRSALQVTATVSTRCVAGKGLVTVVAQNDDDTTLALTLQSAYGAKSFADIAPGKRATHAFATRLSTVPAGSITLVATASATGQESSQVLEYPAKSC
ncbi:RICIN domain-containing protein [Agromyces sp. MMS24-K17]|uniref:RICIN domain-containing protein n=1 Tax=Agromyces sp. MMS24-K17 TaxID=3372850 RepID=UPI0037542FCB